MYCPKRNTTFWACLDAECQNIVFKRRPKPLQLPLRYAIIKTDDRIILEFILFSEVKHYV